MHEEDLHKDSLKRMWRVFSDSIVPVSPLIPRTVFKLNYSASDSADKNGVKNRLKKFISRRPSMKTLQEKGLIKGERFAMCPPYIYVMLIANYQFQKSHIFYLFI